MLANSSVLIGSGCIQHGNSAGYWQSLESLGEKQEIVSNVNTSLGSLGAVTVDRISTSCYTSLFQHDYK